MANGMLNFFDPYDLMGKSLPGMAFLIGLSVFLPVELFQRVIAADSDLGASVIVFMVIISAIVILGILIGEAIHTVAVVSEKFMDWWGRRLTNSRNFLYSNSKVVERLIDAELPSIGERERMEKHPILRLFHDWSHGIVGRLSVGFHNIKYLLIGHRRVFQLRLVQQLNYGQGSLYRFLNFYEVHLIERARARYGVEPDELVTAYPVIIGLIEDSDKSRVVKFQSRYAFCRGMWVISLILAALYFAHLTNLLSLVHGSILDQVSISGIYMLAGVLGIQTAVFMYGAIRYKLLFVDYIYTAIYGLDHPNDIPWETPGQNRLDEYG